MGMNLPQNIKISDAPAKLQPEPWHPSNTGFRRTNKTKSTYSFLIRELRVRLFNHGRFEFFSRSVRVFQRIAAHEVLELDGGLGGAAGLLHDGKAEDLVGFAVEFHRETIFNVGRVNGGHGPCG